MELISAIATAQGAGGVAIVRVSGDGALMMVVVFFILYFFALLNRLF